MVATPRKIGQGGTQRLDGAGQARAARRRAIGRVGVAGLLLTLVVPGTACVSTRQGLIEAAASAEYTGIFDEPVRLEGGRYEGPPFVPGGATRPELFLLPEPFATSESGGGAGLDAVVVLVQAMGGSGSFVHLAALRWRGAAVEQAGHVPLGDRVRVQSLAIRDGIVYATIVEHGPDDPMCCPADTTQRAWRLSDGALVAVPLSR